jgi:hypothetical protein
MGVAVKAAFMVTGFQATVPTAVLPFPRVATKIRFYYKPGDMEIWIPSKE